MRTKTDHIHKHVAKVAPWPGFEPGSCHRAFFSVMSSGRQPLILDRTILPGLSYGRGAEMDREEFA